MKILFFLKTNASSGGTEQSSKSGLYNAARFVVDTIDKFDDVSASLIQVKDQNAVYNQIVLNQPNIVIIEAVWITPGKLQDLTDRFPHIRFITRVHSRIPFIAMEGNVVEWIKKYEQFSEVAFNNKQTSRDMDLVGIRNLYLPNIYPDVTLRKPHQINKKHYYKIGCFGSLRPLKNQLAQAVGALIFAAKNNAIIHFYINASVEQNGDGVLKSIRAFFANSRHKLIEVDWKSQDEFLKLLSDMDACMQVSFTETFNLTTADAILAHVPVVVSPQIDWLSCRKANPNNESDIAEVLDYIIQHNTEQVEDNIRDLHAYNHHATTDWIKFLKR